MEYLRLTRHASKIRSSELVGCWGNIPNDQDAGECRLWLGTNDGHTAAFPHSLAIGEPALVVDVITRSNLAH